MYDRYRTRTNIDNAHLSYMLPDKRVFSDTLSISSVQHTWDSITPGFHQLSAAQRQALPVNHFKSIRSKVISHSGGRWEERGGTKTPCVSGTLYDWADGDLGMYLLHTTQGVWPFGTLPTGVTSSLPTANQLIPEALAEARLKDLDVLTMLAELSKTAQLLTGVRDRVLQRANKITTRLRKKGKLDAVVPRSVSNAAALATARTRANGRLFQSFLDAFTETWMEHRYGWRILLYDLEGIYEAWLKLQAGVGPVVKGKAEAARVYDEYTSIADKAQLITTQHSVGMLYYRMEYYRRVEESRRVGLGYQFAFNSLLTVDPIVTALEIVPFSFIADWFTNVGDIVRAYSPFGAGNVLWLWENTLVELRHSASFTSKGTSTYGCCPVGDVVSADTSKRLFERHPLVWNDHVPEVRWFNDLDVPKLLDAVSVLRGLSGPLKPWLRI